MAEKIIQALDFPWVVLLSMDSFYKVLLYFDSCKDGVFAVFMYINFFFCNV